MRIIEAGMTLEAFTADDLLRLVTRDPEAPHYTEAGWESKERRAHRRALEWREVGVSRGLTFEACEELALVTVGRVVRAADLSRPRGEVFGLWIAGFSFLEIGAFRATSKQSAHWLNRQALVQIASAYESEPLSGMSSVYADMVRPRTSLAAYL